MVYTLIVMNTDDWFDGLDYEKQKYILRRAVMVNDTWKLYYNEVTDLRYMNPELCWVDIPSDLQWHIQTEVRNSWE